MFKNLKQKVTDERLARTPTASRSGTPQQSLQRQSSSTSKLPRPSHSSLPHGTEKLASEKSGKGGDTGAQSVKHTQNAKKDPGTPGVKGEALGSLDVIRRIDVAAAGDAPLAATEGVNSSPKSIQSTPTSEAKVPFFKRLEFLTPLKDQVAAKLSESKESLSSLVGEVRENVTPASNNRSKPDVVAQANEQNQFDSLSDAEESPVSHQNTDVSAIPKEQLFGKIIRLEKTLLRYREKYSELSAHFRDMKHEKDKLQTVMQQSQDKNLRRIQELKEAAVLDQKTKMHLEEEFQVSLEEKDQLIKVLHTQVAILKGEKQQSVNTRDSTSSDDDLLTRLMNVEEKLKFERETSDGLRSQGDALQVQLDERLDEVEKLKDENMSEKSKLIKQLRDAKNVIEQLEDDKQMAVAEAKRQMHEMLESRDTEVVALQQRLTKLQASFDEFKVSKEKLEKSSFEQLEKAISAAQNAEEARKASEEENKRVKIELEEHTAKVEKSLEEERKTLVAEVSRSKAQVLKLMQRQSQENMEEASRKQDEILKQKDEELASKLAELKLIHEKELNEAHERHENNMNSCLKKQGIAMQEQANQFKVEMEKMLKEKEEQMRLAIEERELSKMAAVSQQDAEAQNILRQLDQELENVRTKVDELEQARVREEKEHNEVVNKLKEEMLKSNENYKTELERLEESLKSQLVTKAQESLESTAALEKSYKDELEVQENKWKKQVKDLEESYLEELNKLKSRSEKADSEKTNLFQQQVGKIQGLEKELESLFQQNAAQSQNLLKLESELRQKDERLGEATGNLQKLSKMIEDERKKSQIKLEEDALALEKMTREMEGLKTEINQAKKDLAEKENLLHEKNEASLRKLEELKNQKEAFKTKCIEIENKQKTEEELMKKRVVESDESQKTIVLNLQSQLEVNKREFEAKVAALEHAKVEIENSQKETHKKFMEAGGRLKALANKYKATVADHEKTLAEKESVIMQEKMEKENLEKKILVLDNKIKQDAEQHKNLIDDMEETLKTKYTTEKEEHERGLKEQFHKENQELKQKLLDSFAQEKDILIQNFQQSREAEKQQLQLDLEARYERDKTVVEEKLQCQAADKEKSLQHLLENTERQQATIQIKLSEAEGQIKNLTEQLKSALQELTTKDDEVNAAKQKAEEKEAEVTEAQKNLEYQAKHFNVLQEEFSTERLGLEKKIMQLEDSVDLQVERKQMQEQLEAKLTLIDSLTKLLDVKDEETQVLKKEANDLTNQLKEATCKTESQRKETADIKIEMEKLVAMKSSNEEIHESELQKVQKEWNIKYSELKQKAEQKIAQLQSWIKDAKTELTKQHEVILHLQEKQTVLENQTKEFTTDLQASQLNFENEKHTTADLIKKLEEEKKLSQLALSEKCELEKKLWDAQSLTEAAEKGQNEVLTELKTRLAQAQTDHVNANSIRQSLETKVVELEECYRNLESSLASKESEYERLLEECKLNSQSTHEKDETIKQLQESKNTLEAEIGRLASDVESAQKNELDGKTALETTRNELEELGNLMERTKNDYLAKESLAQQKLIDQRAEMEQKMEKLKENLEQESQKKLNDLKKKAEQRLAQIKANFTTKLEEASKTVSRLEGEKSVLQEESSRASEKIKMLEASKNSSEALVQEEFEKIREDHAQSFQAEKEKYQISLKEEITEMKKRVEEESEKRIEELMQEEKIKYQEEKLQLAEVKDHLEEVLKEAKLKLQETENKMYEEKDRADVALQEEKDKSLQIQLRLSVAVKDFEKERTGWLQEKLDSTKKFSEMEILVEDLKANAAKQGKEHDEKILSCLSQLDAARKRNEKLEKEREALKQDKNDLIMSYDQQIKALQDQINSAQKEAEVLSKTAVEDNDIEVERKLEALKEDFNRRLTAKDEENAAKIKRLMKEYETQYQENDHNHQAKLASVKEKQLAIQDSLRAQHHKELMALQREIQSKEKELESCIEKYETEMHEMESNMSSQVDKASYRAMTAEKKLQDTGWEEKEKNLQSQLSAVNKILAETQERERANASQLASIQARISLATPLADPEKLEYLRRIMYEYMMGNENRTMAKVLVVLLQFNDLEAQQILEKHKLSSEWLAKS